MSSKQHNKSQVQNTEKLKEIPKWTRRYTENRTLPFLVNMLLFSLMWTVGSISCYFGGRAYRSGNRLLFWICMVPLILFVAAVIFFSVQKWGGRLIEKLIRWLYREDGQVVLAIPEKTKKEKLTGLMIGLVFGTFVMISVILGVLGYIPDIPIRYMQPISAIFFVPLIIVIGIWRPPSINPLGFLCWLWPTLYVIHGILIVAGVPIHFDRPWIFLNMLIPVAGYGILCGLIGHIYSRFALRKLKTLAKAEEQNSTIGLGVKQ